jgi:large conductance mechanosensitive channel
MSFLKDFKAFAFKGNAFDLAVGVIIGAAFGSIVTALVNDIIMPPIGIITGGATFTDKFIVLKNPKPGLDYKSLADAKAAGANVFAYGDFIQTVINFLIVAFCIFLFIRILGRFKAKNEAEQAAKAITEPSSTDKLLAEIRDELRKRA